MMRRARRATSDESDESEKRNDEREEREREREEGELYILQEKKQATEKLGLRKVRGVRLDRAQIRQARESLVTDLREIWHRDQLRKDE